MTNRNKTIIYTGVTNDLKRRVQEHKDVKRVSALRMWRKVVRVIAPFEF